MLVFEFCGSFIRSTSYLLLSHKRHAARRRCLAVTILGSKSAAVNPKGGMNATPENKQNQEEEEKMACCENQRKKNSILKLKSN
jgi:hypothetical protein